MPSKRTALYLSVVVWGSIVAWGVVREVWGPFSLLGDVFVLLVGLWVLNHLWGLAWRYRQTGNVRCTFGRHSWQVVDNVTDGDESTLLKIRECRRCGAEGRRLF